MAIVIKSDEQIEKMRIAGKIVKQTHEIIKQAIKPGISTLELDKIAEDFILSKNAIPSFKGYNGFSGSICASINEEVIHGIPKHNTFLKDGDIISIDIGAFIDGFHGDAARTWAVGTITDDAKKLITVTENSFFEGMKMAKAGNHLFEISAAIDDYVTSHGFTLVREYCGHGIGKDMHEDPQIPNYKQKKRGPKLSRNMTLAIEPMVNMGTEKVNLLADGWTVVTADKKMSAHYENTIVITDGDEPELLTF